MRKKDLARKRKSVNAKKKKSDIARKRRNIANARPTNAARENWLRSMLWSKRRSDALQTCESRSRRQSESESVRPKPYTSLKTLWLSLKSANARPASSKTCCTSITLCLRRSRPR